MTLQRWTEIVIMLATPLLLPLRKKLQQKMFAHPVLLASMISLDLLSHHLDSKMLKNFRRTMSQKWLSELAQIPLKRENSLGGVGYYFLCSQWLSFVASLALSATSA